jgi:hypothetical protein
MPPDNSKSKAGRGKNLLPVSDMPLILHRIFEDYVKTSVPQNKTGMNPA